MPSLFLNNVRLSWCSPAIYPGPAICVASLKKTREGADTGFPVPLSQWTWSLSEKMHVGWAQCRALSESSGPGLVCYWEALTLRQALPVTTTNRAPDPTKWFHRTGKKWWLGKLFHNAVLFTWSSSSQRDQTGGSLTQSGGIKEAEFCASEMLKGPWHLAKDGERPLQEEWTSRAKLEGREGR